MISVSELDQCILENVRSNDFVKVSNVSSDRKSRRNNTLHITDVYNDFKEKIWEKTSTYPVIILTQII